MIPTIAQANNVVAKRWQDPLKTSWNMLPTDDDRLALLAAAADVLDLWLRHQPLAGVKADASQRYSFPRVIDGGAPATPDDVLSAVTLTALFVLADPNLADPPAGAKNLLRSSGIVPEAPESIAMVTA